MSRTKNLWWDEITSPDYLDEYREPDFDQFELNLDQPKKLGLDLQKEVDKLYECANMSIVDDDDIPF